MYCKSNNVNMCSIQDRYDAFNNIFYSSCEDEEMKNINDEDSEVSGRE